MLGCVAWNAVRALQGEVKQILLFMLGGMSCTSNGRVAAITAYQDYAQPRLQHRQASLLRSAPDR